MKILKIHLLPAALLLLCACTRTDRDIVVSPGAPEEQPAAAHSKEPHIPYREYLDFSEDFPQPYIEPDYEQWELRYSRLHNLDERDRQDEQLIILQNRREPDSNLLLQVLDYSLTKGGWFVFWESETLYPSYASLSVDYLDITGDFRQEIILNGRSAGGNYLFEVYHLEDSGYRPICTLATPGKVEIEVRERLLSYSRQIAYGVSFRIKINESLADGGNPLDTRITTMDWNADDLLYETIGSEVIRGEAIADQLLRELYDSPKEAWEQHLNGIWQKVDSEERIFLTFDSTDPDNREIAFIKEGSMEINTWRNSWKFKSSAVNIELQNKFIKYIYSEFDVTFREYNLLRVTHDDRKWQSLNSWQGDYRKIESGELTDLARPAPPPTPPAIGGYYYDNLGKTLYFDYPNFFLKEGETRISGGYAFFHLGEDLILQWKILDTSGLVSETRTYLVEYREEIDGNRTTRYLKCMPVTLNVTDYIRTDADILWFEQSETRE